MDFLKSLKTKLILQIGILIAISTLFVLILVNTATQRDQPRESLPVTVDLTLPIQEQREDIQNQIREQLNQERRETAARILLTSVFGIFLQIIFTSIGTYFLIKRELKPIENLNRSMQEINEKLLYLKIIIPDDASSEISKLIENFNLMISRLNTAFKSQKQFVENVSHEVKTPLTVIRTNLESILLDGEISEEDREAAIKNSIDSINFLNKLVEDLLLISFLGKSNLKLSQIDIQLMVRSLVKELNLLDESKSIEFKGTKKNLLIEANDILLKRAFGNIIENAIKYSKRGSKINVNIEKSKKDILIKVMNEGDEIPEEYRVKIFERFFRVDKSRSRSTGGFGLGLSITKEILELYKGKISVESSNGINIFTIVLPQI